MAGASSTRDTGGFLGEPLSAKELTTVAGFVARGGASGSGREGKVDIDGPALTDILLERGVLSLSSAAGVSLSEVSFRWTFDGDRVELSALRIESFDCDRDFER